MKRSKDLEFLHQRLDGVRMTESERIRARAQIERAEAVADLFVEAGRALDQAYRHLVVRPLRRIAHAG